MNLLYFVLVCFGLTSIIVYGKIFDKIRPSWKLFNCCACMGFWVGLFVWIISPFSTLFNFDNSVVTGFFLACLSSGTSYIMCSVFGDEGIKHEFKQD